MNEEKAMEIYKYAKTKIQLVETSLESLKTDKLIEYVSDDLQHEISFGTRISEIDEKQKAAFLHTIVHSKDQNSGEAHLLIQMIHKGVFRSSERLEEDEFNDFIQVQIVPQLIPYARSLVSSISVEMRINPIVLPTMDILKSIVENDAE